MKELTTYQIYLILLGYLAERHDDTEMLKSMLTELYARADKNTASHNDNLQSWIIEKATKEEKE